MSTENILINNSNVFIIGGVNNGNRANNQANNNQQGTNDQVNANNAGSNHDNYANNAVFGDIDELCWYIQNAQSKTERDAFNGAAANVTKLKFMAYSNNDLSVQTKDIRDVLLYTKSPAKATTAVRDMDADGRMTKKQVITVEKFLTAEEIRNRHQQPGGPFSSFPDAHEVIRKNMSLTEVRALSRAALKLIDVEEKIKRRLETMSDHLRTALTAKINVNPRHRQGKKERAFYRNQIKEEKKMTAVKVRSTAKHQPPRTKLMRTRSHFKTVQIDDGEQN